MRVKEGNGERRVTKVDEARGSACTHPFGSLESTIEWSSANYLRTLHRERDCLADSGHTAHDGSASGFPVSVLALPPIYARA